MPQIILKGISREVAVDASKNLAKKLSEVSNTPEDYFLFEYVNSEYLNSDIYPLIEVKQFKRPKSIEEKMAQIIADSIKKISNYTAVEVYFIHIEETDYYEF